MPLSAARARPLLQAIAGRRVLVVGDLMLDHYLWGDTRRISPEAPVPVVTVQRESHRPGGAANVALNAAALGARVTLAGTWGDDDAGRLLADSLREAGVNLLGRPTLGVPTIRKTRVVLRTQQLCRLDQEAPAIAYHPDVPALLRRLGRTMREADAVLLSDYAKGFLTPELVHGLGTRARAVGRLVALDPHPGNPLDLATVDLLKPNRAEALALAGITLPADAPFPAEALCRQLHESHGLRHLVITLGEEGMLVSTRGRAPHAIPTSARQVFDVTGAGDTSLATLVLGLVAGADLATAAHLANAAAGVVVGKLGTATATPAEILAHLSRRATS